MYDAQFDVLIYMIHTGITSSFSMAQREITFMHDPAYLSFVYEVYLFNKGRMPGYPSIEI